MSGRFSRTMYFLLGLVLIPFCWSATRVAAGLVKDVHPDVLSSIPPSAWALGGGFVLWIFLFYTLPRPVRSYVLAHELTHALWGAIMGAKVSKLRVARDSGSVTLSKNNFLITLSPYFFPLYTVLAILIYWLLYLFVEVEKYELYWLGVVGFTWGFHFTFTLTTLMERQSDIREFGRLFSYAVIYSFNVVGIAVWIVMVTPATLEQMMLLYSREIGLIGDTFRQILSAAGSFLMQ